GHFSGKTIKHTVGISSGLGCRGSPEVPLQRSRDKQRLGEESLPEFTGQNLKVRVHLETFGESPAAIGNFQVRDEVWRVGLLLQGNNGDLSGGHERADIEHVAALDLELLNAGEDIAQHRIRP